MLLWQFHNETGIHIKVHCWNFVGYEAKLLRARAQTTCRPELAEYAGNFYVLGYTFANDGCNSFLCNHPIPGARACAAFPFSPYRDSWTMDESTASRFVQHAM